MQQADPALWLPAEWPAPANVCAGTSLRGNSTTADPWDGFNLAAHVNDEPERVVANRCRLQAMLGLATEPCWLQQVHGNNVIAIDHGTTQGVVADAAWTAAVGTPCAVLTADCIPVLLCNKSGTRVAAVHVGWRGLCHGILNRTLDSFAEPPAELLAWLGPHICQAHYEVGTDVIRSCAAVTTGVAAVIEETRHGHGLLDLAGLARLLLSAAGMREIYINQECTFENEQLFYSWRRNRVTGRMASLVWMDSGS